MVSTKLITKNWTVPRATRYAIPVLDYLGAWSTATVGSVATTTPNSNHISAADSSRKEQKAEEWASIFSLFIDYLLHWIHRNNQPT